MIFEKKILTYLFERKRRKSGSLFECKLRNARCNDVTTTPQVIGTEGSKLPKSLHPKIENLAGFCMNTQVTQHETHRKTEISVAARLAARSNNSDKSAKYILKR
jgi:hypothetical protein